MNLSMRWLKEYVDLDEALPIREFCEKMTMSGSKVEGYETECAGVENVIVGRVLSIEKHPDSDHLNICQVDVGKIAPIQIVTGAQNVVPGALVPVAMDHSVLPGGVKIKKGRLRGVESNGMLCSLGELGLTAHDFPYAVEDGIFLISEEEGCKIGDAVPAALGIDDTVVEFEITPNRPDCLSMLGLAREAAATFDKPFRQHQPQVKEEGNDPVQKHLDVKVENPQLCPRYIARMVKNIKIAPSPRWMRERLRACGVRPINNIVDITNYVCLEYGQPMHAFDYNCLKDGKIVVRNAQDGESITLLDGNEKNLTSDMLVIADQEKPVAVAGVMGGEFSGISGRTNQIVFESASFNGPSVRVTAKKLGVRTEASARYEKGLDPQNVYGAVQRACELVQLLGCGEVMEGMIDVDNTGYQPARIYLDTEYINRFLGISVSKERMIKILEKLEFTIDGDTVIVPSFRTDVEHKADLAEEVARFYGYDNIPTTLFGGAQEGKLTAQQQFERMVLSTMIGMGAHEISTYSFISPKFYDRICLPPDHPRRESVVILNPLGEDTSVMRTTILPSMLEVLAKNYANRNPKAKLFELGFEYLPVEGRELPQENLRLAIGLYGSKYDFFTLKGMLEALLSVCKIGDWDIQAVSDLPWLHPGRGAVILVGEHILCTLGEVHPTVLQNYGIGARALVADVDMALLFRLSGRNEIQYRPLPKHPATTRDLAVLCKEETPIGQIEKMIRSVAGKTIESIQLFDVYTGQQIEAGKKSVAFSLILRAPDRTLTDGEADALIKKILQKLGENGITIRG